VDMLAIGEVARRAGLRSSTIRYYERIGLLPKPQRQSGRRRYTEDVLFLLEVIRFAQGTGFTLREIQRLFDGRPFSSRLRQLARDKIAELEARAERISVMRSLLQYGLRCNCMTLEECGRRLGKVDRRRLADRIGS
jgi:MerR family redox-sensitive transcriptional activator SoxR